MGIIDYDLIEDVSILLDSKIILYGAGFWAKKALDFLREAEIYPEFVCQTNVTCKYFYGLRIESFTEVLNKFDNSEYLLIVASIDYYSEMLQMCSRFNKTKVCTLYGLFTSIKMHVKEHFFPEEFKKKVEAGIAISRDLFLPKFKMSAINRFVQAALAPEDHVWIFQPGKVGSQSIWNSIQNKSIQFHTLAAAYKFADIEKEYLDYYREIILQKKIKIITAVREPISRDIAVFFQNSDLDLWPYHDYNCNIFLLCGSDDDPKAYMDLNEVKKRCPLWRNSLNESFKELAYAIMHYKQDVFSWFDYEINNIFGIDIYSYPFDQKRGYSIVEKNNIQILIVKMEVLSSLEKVIGEFIGNDKYKLINRNKASDKIYYYAYKEFKKNIRIPSTYFEFYYGGNFKYEHFYSQEEIEENYKFWSKYVYGK